VPLGGEITIRLFQQADRMSGMSLTTDDFRALMGEDPEDDDSIALGDALSELAVKVEVDSVEAVRDVRKRR
jgi:hypothetical protein